MPKNHHLLAIEKGVKTKTDERLTAIYKSFQKPDLFNGHVKTFQPRAENQDAANYEMLPEDRKHVQQHVSEGLKSIRSLQTELFDLTFQLNVTNAVAKADVVVDGATILKDAPATYLLWLGHQLDNLHTEVKKIPVLDSAEKWDLDAEANLYSTKPTEQVRTKKLEVPLVLHPPTKEHPAQVKAITQDVITGTWKQTKYSSAMPADKKEQLVIRVEKLQNAVKQALETANGTDVPKDLPSAGKAFFDFVFAP